jgi:hypothetical protein
MVVLGAILKVVLMMWKWCRQQGQIPISGQNPMVTMELNAMTISWGKASFLTVVLELRS